MNIGNLFCPKIASIVDPSIACLQYKLPASFEPKFTIPEHIYHFTTQSSYEGMKRTGNIKTSFDTMVKGIFTIDLPNFLKHWTEDRGKINYARNLLNRVFNIDNNVVLLRIPTEKLNSDELAIRSQCTLFDWLKKVPEEEINKAAHEFIEQGQPANSIWLKIIEKFTTPEEYQQISGNYKAKDVCQSIANDPFELIYKKFIPFSDVEKVADIKLHKKVATSQDFSEALSALLKGTKEEKQMLEFIG